MKKLYLFDFDGTLTDKDTMFLFLKFYNPSRYRMMYLKHLPLFFLLKTHLLQAENVKKSFIASILKGEGEEKINRKSEQFFQKYYPKIFRENALSFIHNIDKEKTTCYIVTAFLDIWVKPFAKHFNMELIATKAEFLEGKYTGNFIGKNCNGKEKVTRIKQAVNNLKFDKIIAFGDSEGDKEMLAFANESFYRFFH